MFNILTEQHVGLALALGAIFLGVILFILIIGYLWTFAWAYLDDGDSKIKNPAFALFKRVTGFYPVPWGHGVSGTNSYTRSKEHEGQDYLRVRAQDIKTYDAFLLSFMGPILILLSPPPLSIGRSLLPRNPDNLFFVRCIIRITISTPPNKEIYVTYN